MPVIRLRLLSDFQCRTADGCSVDPPLAKDQGLLAILALSPNFTSSRGKITNLLWSTRSDEQARASLRQSLWSLKKSLGQIGGSVFEVNRRRVALDPSQISTDVQELRELAASNTVESLERAVGIYKGDLLSDLIIRDPAWEEWLSKERESIQSLVVTTLRKLIDCYAAESDSTKIIAAGRRLSGFPAALSQVFQRAPALC